MAEESLPNIDVYHLANTYDDQTVGRAEWMDAPTPLFIVQTFLHYPTYETQFTTGSDHLHFRTRTNLYISPS